MYVLAWKYQGFIQKFMLGGGVTVTHACFEARIIGSLVGIYTPQKILPILWSLKLC